MFKDLIKSLQKNPSLEGKENKKKVSRKKNPLVVKAWKKTVKRIDAAIPRKRAIIPAKKATKDSVTRPVSANNDDGYSFDESKLRIKKATKNRRVFLFDGKPYLLYEKNSKFSIKRLNDRLILKRDHEISLVNNFSYDVDLKNISHINISQIGKSLIMSYRRDSDYDSRTTAFAVSLDGIDFKEVSSVDSIKNNFVFAKKDISQGKYLAYTGENFIHFASSDSLKKWDISKEHMLTPRQNFFDAEALRMIDTIEIPEGILLLYESSVAQDDHYYLQVGGALFDKNHPEKIIWRSPYPIWEQTFALQEIEEVSSLGVILKNNRICLYYSVNDDFMMADFAIPRFVMPKKDIVTINRHHKNPIITPNPNNKWESKAVFNAAAIHANGKYHLIYRAIGEDDVSSLGYACSDDGFDFDTRLGFPVYVPREKFEGVYGKPYRPCADPAIYESGGGCCGGCEDPRITRVKDTLYMTYVAYNGHDVPGVAVTSIKYEDFINQRWNWEKARLISKPGQIQKNWVLFPEKINGKYALIHGLSPKVHIEYVKNFEDMDGKGYIDSLPPAHGKGFQDPSRMNHWDNIVRGTGAPPLKTKYGWLVFYHAMDRRDPNRYKIGAMILDLKNPEKILYRSRKPILEPDEKYENEGMKAGVIYVCGAIIEKDMLHIYYGGADMVMCVATSKLDDFLEDMIQDEKVDLKKIAAK